MEFREKLLLKFPDLEGNKMVRNCNKVINLIKQLIHDFIKFLCCKYLKFHMDQNLIQQNSRQRDCLVSCTLQSIRCQYPLINYLESTIVVTLSWHHDKRASKIPSLDVGSEP